MLIDLVRDLGGSTIPSRLDDGQALPLDCSFGHGEPLLARPDSMLARPRNERILPEVLHDAHAVINRLRQRDDLADLSNTDFLTGLLNGCAVDQLLSRLRPDDAVVVMNIDNFRTVNDRWGHAVGDEVLIAFARTLRSDSRPGDQFGRLGGDELLAVLFRAEHTGLDSFLDRLRETWLLIRPRDVTYSAGLRWWDAEPGSKHCRRPTPSCTAQRRWTATRWSLHMTDSTRIETSTLERYFSALDPPDIRAARLVAVAAQQ